VSTISLSVKKCLKKFEKVPILRGVKKSVGGSPAVEGSDTARAPNLNDAKSTGKE
jgi:hypothetical protein